MTTLVKELRDALVDAGASAEKADAAASSVVDRSMLTDFATKTDLYRALLVHAGVVVALVKFLP